jgi:hypothetical protein
MEYRQLKRLTQDYILPLILNWKFILVLCGQGSSFMVNDISGVFWRQKSMMWIMQSVMLREIDACGVGKVFLLMNSTVEYGRLLLIIHLIPLNSA